MTTYMEQLKSDILKVTKEHLEENLDNFHDWLLDNGKKSCLDLRSRID